MSLLKRARKLCVTVVLMVSGGFLSLYAQGSGSPEQILQNLKAKADLVRGNPVYKDASQELLHAAEKYGDHQTECAAWNNLADFYYTIRDGKSLRQVYDTLMVLTRKYGEMEQFYNVSSTQSLFLLQELDLNQAYEICMNTIQQATEDRDTTGLYISEIMMARFFNTTKMNERAIKECEKAIELELKIKDHTFGTGLVTALMCCVENESWEKADELLKTYGPLVNSVRTKAYINGKRLIMNFFLHRKDLLKADKDSVRLYKEKYDLDIRQEDNATLRVIDLYDKDQYQEALKASYDVPKPLRYSLQMGIFARLNLSDSILVVNQRQAQYFNQREEVLYESDARKVLLENKLENLSKANETLEEDNSRLHSNLFYIVLSALFVLMVVTIIFLLIHIYNKRRYTRSLLRQNKEIQKANNFKTQFIQNMSHEVRTPLNAICGFSQLLANPEMNEVLTQEEKEQYSDIIGSNTDLLTNLVNDILDLGDIESGKYRIYLQDVPVNQVCKKSLNTVEHRLMGSPVTLKFVSSLDDDVTINSDPARIQQILVNFLTNAIKHTEEGSITLSVEPLENGHVRFSVTDTGEGVAPENAEAIFQRFEKLNTFKQGTGLGLPICRSLADCLGGKVYLDTSHPAPGARFNLDL